MIYIYINTGIMYDNLSFKVLQYNPPQTLPWLRRNEVTVKVLYKVDKVNGNNNNNGMYCCVSIS